jgi:hypothetical protein
MSHWCRTFVLAMSITGLGTPLGAQAVALGLAGGIAVPTGAYGEARATGPLVQVSGTVGGPQRRLRLRMDVEGAWFAGSGTPTTRGLSAAGGLRVLSSGLNLLVGPRGGPVRPYALVGLSAQRLRATGRVNPYRMVPGVRAGVGMRAALGGVEWRAEVTPHLVLSDYATGRDFDVGSYWPVTLGVSVSL